MVCAAPVSETGGSQTCRMACVERRRTNGEGGTRWMSEEVVAYRINDAAGFGRRTLDHRRDMPTSMNGSTQHTRAMIVNRERRVLLWIVYKKIHLKKTFRLRQRLQPSHPRNQRVHATRTPKVWDANRD